MTNQSSGYLQSDTATPNTHLSTSHQVSACGNDRDRILLHGSRGSVTSVADVLEEHRIQRWVRKLSNRLWHTSTSGLDGNVVVLPEIDPSVLLGRVILLAVELFLHAHVTVAGNVLALLAFSNGSFENDAFEESIVLGDHVRR